MRFRKIGYILIFIIFTSCWAPRCPMKSCHVKFEHLHEGGAYRGGSFITARKHWPWEKSGVYSESKRKKKEEKKKGKWKLFDWERE